MTPDCEKEDIRQLRSHYRSGNDDLAEDFFRPCMLCCTSYDRAVGFFSSSSLVTWSSAIPRFVQLEQISIRLLIAPYLSEEDRGVLEKAINQKERRTFLQRYSDRVLDEAVRFAENPGDTELRLRLLLWLIASGRLEVRFAYPPQYNSRGIYHEKIGVFSFPWGDSVAFTGSANETAGGHTLNYETLDVFRSWEEADRARVRHKKGQFENAWTGEAGGIEVMRPSKEAMERVKSVAPEERPRQAAGGTGKSEILKASYKWRHQEEAVGTFLEEKRGILEMATGTGKTRTALKIIKRLADNGEVSTVIVATHGTDLLRQWQNELLWLVQELKEDYSLLRHFHKFHERAMFVQDPKESVFLVRRKALSEALRRLPPEVLEKTILVHDEVHRLGSTGNRGKLEGLADEVTYRLGLSATPERKYDEAGNRFVESHIGPVIYEFGLADAIERHILVPFDYYPLEYEPDERDRQRLQKVFKQKAAREAEGDPMSDEELAIQLAKVHKTSEAKLPKFEEFISRKPQILERCIIFVAEREYGEKVLNIVHRYRHDFHTYYGGDEMAVLERFGTGELECLVTCEKLSEGIDIQDLGNVILFSSPRAKLKTIQRIGRCLRTDPENPDKRASVVDFVRVGEDDEQNSDQIRKQWLGRLAQVEPKV